MDLTALSTSLASQASGAQAMSPGVAEPMLLTLLKRVGMSYLAYRFKGPVLMKYAVPLLIVGGVAYYLHTKSGEKVPLPVLGGTPDDDKGLGRHRLENDGRPMTLAGVGYQRWAAKKY